MRFASESLTVRQCGVSEELNISGKQRRETCFRRLIPVVGNIPLKDCPPFPKENLFFHVLLEGVFLQVGTILL
jgi:hypothetical protein